MLWKTPSEGFKITDRHYGFPMTHIIAFVRFVVTLFTHLCCKNCFIYFCVKIIYLGRYVLHNFICLYLFFVFYILSEMKKLLVFMRGFFFPRKHFRLIKILRFFFIQHLIIKDAVNLPGSTLIWTICLNSQNNFKKNKILTTNDETSVILLLIFGYCIARYKWGKNRTKHYYIQLRIIFFVVLLPT